MKVIYRNSDTTTVEIETSEEIAITLTDSYREEDNYDRKCRYHNYSMDAAVYEGKDYECIVDGAFVESEFRSAPYFDLRIDGITELN